MIHITLLIFMSLGRPARAADIAAQLEYSCYTEISFFCPKTEAKAKPWLKCLETYQDSVTSRCLTAMQATKEALAPKPPPVVQPAALAAANTATQQPAASLPAEMDARLTHSEGSVYVHYADQPDNTFVKAENDMPLQSGDLIRTGTDGKAELGINAESAIELGNNTDFQVAELSPEKTQWHLEVGSLVAKIHSLVQSQQMEFGTSSAVAAIRGTELAVAQDDSGQPTRIGVLDEGKVAVTSAGGGQPVLLQPGQETAVSKGQPPTLPKPLSTLANARKEMDQVRKRVNDMKREWKQENRHAREEMRQQFSKKNPISADKLSNIRDSQRHLTYTASHADAARSKQQQGPSGVHPLPGNPSTHPMMPVQQHGPGGLHQPPPGGPHPAMPGRRERRHGESHQSPHGGQSPHPEGHGR